MCVVGEMAQDVGMVESIAVSSPSSLVGFEGSIPTCACFHSENFFCDLFLLFFFFVFFRGRCMICNVQKYRTLLFTKNKVSS